MPFMKLGDPLFFMEKSNNQHETIVIIRNLDPLCGSKKSSANSDRLPQPIPSHDLDQYRDRICHGARLFFVIFLSRHLYYLYLFGVCHAAHCGPVHPRGVGALGRLRPRWQPHRGGHADVDDYGDFGDICDDDDRDTIRFLK